jgi:hypothetical protein
LRPLLCPVSVGVALISNEEDDLRIRWSQIDKREWRAEAPSCQQLIVRVVGMERDSNRFLSYRANKYLGSSGTIEEAKELCELGRRQNVKSKTKR